MAPEEFNQLQHGNVIADERGKLFIVSQSVRNAAGQVVYVGLTPAIGAGIALDFSIVSKISTQTMLVGKSVPPIE